MRSEADVRVFATSLQVDPVRPVLLEMLPDAEARDYNWVIFSEVTAPPQSSLDEDSSVPDMALMRRVGATTGTGTVDHPVILIEFKAPLLVYGARHSALNRSDASPDWIAMTKQLRKYAVVWNCRRLILMDEKMVWFFYIPGANLKDPNSHMYCISAKAPSPSATSTLGHSPPAPPASSAPPSVPYSGKSSNTNIGNLIATCGGYTSCMDNSSTTAVAKRVGYEGTAASVEPTLGEAIDCLSLR
jgi:hypothetical protein